MMTVMAVDREQQAAQSRQAAEETRRRAVAKARQQTAWLKQASQEPEQQQEFIRQNNVIYGGLIAMGLVLVQPFLTVSGLNWSAKICVIAFSVAIPLLAALLMVNHQETFRRRVTNSLSVRVFQSIAQMLAYVGVVAGFWHIMWPAGVAIMVSGFVALMVHSAGYFRLEIDAKAEAAAAAGAEPAETAGNATPHSSDDSGQ
jgi:cation transport ATPase